MAATLTPQLRPAPVRPAPAADRPALRVVGPPRRTYWHRRAAVLLAALALVAGTVLVLRAAGGLLTHEPPAAPAQPLIPAITYVVQPGDSIWSVARRLQPEGDVRALVDRLVARHGGSALEAGEVIRLG
jgi:hypothetical protein